MKTIKIIKLLCLVFIIASCRSNAESKISTSTLTAVDGLTTVTFKVWGNCGMCKETIESSMKTDDISVADWNKETKIITVSFDDKKITPDQIQKNIASVGYDNEKYKGDDKAYSELPECCQYERK